MADILNKKYVPFTGAKLRQGQTEKAIKHFLKVVTKDRVLLLSIVAGGRRHWGLVATRAFQSLLINQAVLDSVWVFLVKEAGPDPTGQLDTLLRADLVKLKLEKLQGLARFIKDERHLDEVLETYVPVGVERDAIRQQMLVAMRSATKLIH